jgi:hypothetical protein
MCEVLRRGGIRHLLSTNSIVPKKRIRRNKPGQPQKVKIPNLAALPTLQHCAESSGEPGVNAF